MVEKKNIQKLLDLLERNTEKYLEERRTTVRGIGRRGDEIPEEFRGRVVMMLLDLCDDDELCEDACESLGELSKHWDMRAAVPENERASVATRVLGLDLDGVLYISRWETVTKPTDHYSYEVRDSLLPAFKNLFTWKDIKLNMHRAGDPDGNVRSRSLKNLSLLKEVIPEVHYPEAILFILPFLEERDLLVATSAARTLCDLKDRIPGYQRDHVIDKILELTYSKDTNVMIRAMDILGVFGEVIPMDKREAVVNRLMEFTRDGRPGVKKQAVQSIKNIKNIISSDTGTDVVTRFLELYRESVERDWDWENESPVESSSLSGLKEFIPEEHRAIVIDRLIEHTRDENDDVRYIAVKDLLEIIEIIPSDRIGAVIRCFEELIGSDNFSSYLGFYVEEGLKKLKELEAQDTK
jgi:hypothetical protein